MDNDKSVDESWKDAVAKDKESACAPDCGCGHGHEADPKDSDDELAVNFFNYIASMGYQAMIFLGEVPNPITQKTEQNLRQAKFLIDTIALVRDKTKGNLSAQEDQFLNATVYELQMKFVEMSNQKKII